MQKELKKILYAEDEPDIQAIATIALENIGNFVLKTCNSGKEALDNIDEFNPDLVLTDVMMPEVDGPTLLKELKKNPKYENIPVIFMTAKAQTHEIEQYLKLGAVKIITKPFDPITLSKDIREIWGQLNE